jgi:hypothetical protein
LTKRLFCYNISYRFSFPEAIITQGEEPEKMINPQLITTLKLSADQLQRAIPGGKAGILIPIGASLVKRPPTAPPGTLDRNWLDPRIEEYFQLLGEAKLNPRLISWMESGGKESFAIFVAH